MYYSVPDSNEIIVVVFRDDTVWLTQKDIAILFCTTVANINKNLRKAYSDNEISKVSTIANMLIVQQEGFRYTKRIVKKYNLEAILSVGYRINPKRATQFRIWATKRLIFQTLQKIMQLDKPFSPSRKLQSQQLDTTAPQQ